MSDSIPDFLFETQKYLESLGPYPIAIWVVDRPQFYERLKQILPERAFQIDPPPVDTISVYAMDSRRAWQHFPRRPPGFTCIPGVWIEMKNGKHERYEVEE